MQIADQHRLKRSVQKDTEELNKSGEPENWEILVVNLFAGVDVNPHRGHEKASTLLNAGCCRFFTLIHNAPSYKREF